VTLSITFGWLFLGDWLLVRSVRPVATTINWRSSTPAILLLGAMIVLLAGGLIAQNFPFIRTLTRDQTGLDTIRLAGNVTPESTLMIPWGTRHFAVGFAHGVWGELPNITLVDHKADFATIVEHGRLVTPEYTFYSKPVSAWEVELGKPVYLRADAPGMVEISMQADLAGVIPIEDGVSVFDEKLDCTDDQIILSVDWVSAEVPAQDLSVFVHLVDGNDAVIAQADESAPVFGWRPLTSWRASEIIHDVYAVPRSDDARKIRYGLYRQLESGEFQNEYEFEIAVNCQVES
jgi:hypothetical protein